MMWMRAEGIRAARAVVWFGATLLVAGIASAAPPSVEVLGFGGRADTDYTRLWALSPSAPPREIGRVYHRAGSSVKGAVLPDRRVVAVAERRQSADESRDRSWTGAMYLVDETRTEALVGDVYEGSWPVVLDASRVLVARGEAGPVLADEQRIDAIFVDQIDVATKKVKRLYQSHGYLALPIGELRGSVYVADYGPAGVALVAIPKTGAPQIVASELLLGRDFSLDAERSVVYVQVRHADARDRWQVVEIDLATGKKRALIDGSHYGMVPRRWPRGQTLAVNPAPDAGLHWLRLSDPVGRTARNVLRAPFEFGPGVDEVAAVAPNGNSVAILHHATRDATTALWLVDPRSNRGFPVQLPPKELRFEVVGIVDGEVRP